MGEKDAVSSVLNELVQGQPRSVDSTGATFSEATKKFATRLEVARKSGEFEKRLARSKATIEFPSSYPLRERMITLPEIRGAFSRGEVARFDATKLLPKWMFNTSIQRINELHKDTAHQIPVNSGAYYGLQPSCHEPFHWLAKLFSRWGPKSEKGQIAIRAVIPWLLDNECQPFHNLREVAKWSKNFTSKDTPFNYHFGHDEVQKIFDERLSRLEVVSSMEINTRRLDNFDKNLKLVDKLGLESEVEHQHRFVWFGVTGGMFHPDHYDNVLIQLRETVDVYAYSSNCTIIVRDSIDPWKGVLNWAQKPESKINGKQFFHHIRLKPGQGVTIPGSAWHKAVNRKSQRVGYNAFFEPKFGKMRWPGAKGNIFVRNHQDTRAARAVWVKSLAHLFDTKKISMFHHTTRMEII